VLNPWNLDTLEEIEKETGHRIYSVLQLRMHPAITALKKKISKEISSRKYNVELKYITPRGKWYHYSWKGDIDKSGGIATNIGVHFFDILLWIFGQAKSVKVIKHTEKEVSGVLEMEQANVKWEFGIDSSLLPSKGQNNNGYKTMKVDGIEINFSDGAEDLHTNLYKEILNGNGIGVDEARHSIELIHKIRELSRNIS
jgi:UDP-N-acetyl-2-amino-2-deoxyglucuronate dehydrogenase